ncbi:MAG: DEAD/DEAH box helicase family protein [Proteobacteria bacterium]|nr:DEAD/DEAH box helicase family protein [Pseudomonadota bacterium]
MTTLLFEAGTLLLDSALGDVESEWPGFAYDKRTKQWRAPAFIYRDIVIRAIEQKRALVDRARQYQALELKLQGAIVPREHQTQALLAWQKQGSRGVVALPTGAGKTILAVLAIVATQRPTLVLVPTIDLLIQWQAVLNQYLGIQIGALGGGWRDMLPLTVATYDSAYLNIEKLGNRYGLLVFDECHHLPSASYQMIARSSIAPFRLGLSATVERIDGKEDLLYQLVGDLCYEGHIRQMTDSVLAPYDVVSIEVPLSEQEKANYQAARSIYTQFIKQHRIDFSNPQGWQVFIRKASTLPGGREAMDAWREQKRLAQGSAAKMDELWKIISQHRGDRIIIFTQDNAMAYQIGRNFILPVLTHQTRPKERKQMLEFFRNGNLDILVTSKVLNEGVDVPEASVGIVISGSATVREHVQRLGRILRHQAGKRAVLYEVISKDTSEFYVNKRRRNHDAYQRPTQVHKA